MQQLHPLGRHLHVQLDHPSDIGARSAQAGDQTKMYGIARCAKTIGIVLVAFCAVSAAGVLVAPDHGDLATNQFGGHCRQPIILALRPAVFDRHAMAVDVARFLQALAKRALRCSRYGLGDALLRKPITGSPGCCARAASGHATAAPPSERDELAPFYLTETHLTLDEPGLRRKHIHLMRFSQEEARLFYTDESRPSMARTGHCPFRSSANLM